MTEVIAVVVTRNRLSLLKECIRHLQNLEQTFLKKIVIVDNCSDDGTVEYLKDLSDYQLDSIFNSNNEGGAGGFYRGIKHAYEIGCDYIWIMDDDTFVTPSSLSELIKSYKMLNSKGRNVGFIASTALYKDGSPCIMNVSNPFYIWNEFAADNLVRVTHSSFVAMLVPTRVVADVGLPIKEFFIWGDDGEYSTRITKKYEGYSCGNSIVYHMMSENVGVNIFATPLDRVNRFYYFYRNWMFTNIIRDPVEAKKFKFEARKLIRAIKKSDTPGKKIKISTIKKGIADGKKFAANIEYVNGVKKDGFAPPTKKQKNNNHWINRMYAQSINNGTDGGYTNFQYVRYIRSNPSKYSRYKFLKNGVKKSHVYVGYTRSEAFYDLMSNVDIDLKDIKDFVASIDVHRNWCINFRQKDNVSIDFDLFINNGLENLRIEDHDGFGKENDCIIDAMIMYVNRIIEKVKLSKLKNKDAILGRLRNFISSEARSLEDGLQRVCIINQILWQTGHYLVGLGRMDYYLDYLIAVDKRPDEKIIEILIDFYSMMHRYYWYKSSALIGDTGQIIIVGGLDDKGMPFENRLTYLLIESIRISQLPDPKILLRVNSGTSERLWNLTFETISTGVGCPLLANDDVIVPLLIDYGYESGDAYNYTTSACWEPVPGNCYEQNNLGHINFATPFDLISQKEDLSDIKTYEDYLIRYKAHLQGHSRFIANTLNDIIWEFDPLMSACSKICRSRRMDISIGGGKYNNYGLLTNALSNAVNSLLCLKKLVFDDKKYTLFDFEGERISNYRDKAVYETVKGVQNSFGHDDPAVISLTNELVDCVRIALSDCKNKFGGKIKFGTSSPSYLTIGSTSPATFDGRLSNSPYNVHISADGLPYSEIINFASRINYNHMINGNVVDLLVTPDFIKNNKESFKQLITSGMKKGLFEIQFNVVNSSSLRAAKKDPAAYPNLIVRVWGFSAYFNELPEEYKDFIIERAERNEATYI